MYREQGAFPNNHLPLSPILLARDLLSTPTPSLPIFLLPSSLNLPSPQVLSSHFNYKTLMLTSVFSVAPAGNGLHSFRLAEAIFFGSIPVIVDDQILLPFCSVLDWRRFSVRIRSEQIPQLPAILKAIPPETVAAMQARLAEVKTKYFLFPFNTALAMMRLRVREALRQKDAAAAKGRR